MRLKLNMAEKPKASSTPKIVNISSRRRIGHLNNASLQSPIFIPESAGRKNFDTNSEDESDTNIDSDDEAQGDVNKEQENLANKRFCNCLNFYSFSFIGLLLLSMVWLYTYGDGNLKEVPSLERLSQEFPSQVEDFWLYIEVAIQDITKFHRPKTFLFLYNDESEKTLNSLLYKVSQFALCTFSNCSAIPVVLEGNNLNTSYLLEDYGRIIDGNKEKLKESGVMIIKNLEKIPGTSAQAFHSFCDEYNPVVDKALFIFTMKVNNFHRNNVKFVENYLRNLWNDIEDDKFYALFTRLSSIVLPVTIER